MAISIGVISDTHGLLRPSAIEALRGSERIIHAGDVGDARILDSLAEIAPVHAVRGNIDFGPGLDSLAEFEVIQAGAAFIYVRHILDDLDIEPVAAGFHAIIYGHSHRPSIEMQRGVLFLNPGSAGPRRFELPVSVARLRVDGSSLRAEIVPIAT
jgi:putative phosphoesterase